MARRKDVLEEIILDICDEEEEEYFFMCRYFEKLLRGERDGQVSN